ncbi:ERF family protein [Paenibacillus amylolyticus]|uniref:ERF family protein n=1 Tax=Paenibacillus amylolyticus TaxID=1451 RepID=UPI000B81A997|nr:ERF family protein [Paenibacillus amylolyticus]
MCNKSDSIANIAVALVKFNGEVSKIEKDSSNPHFKKKYASLDNIIDEIRPILHKHGLSIMQFPGGDGERFTMTTMLLHESGEWIESQPIVMKPVKNDPQGIGSCTTYARRYSLSAFLSLNTGEDDDGEGASGDRNTSPNNNDTRQSGITPSGALASEGQTKMLYAKHKATGWNSFDAINTFLGYTITKFAEVQAADVTKLAQHLDKHKAA